MDKRLTKYIDGKRHRLVVLKVLKEFPNGTFRVAERIPEQGSVKLEGGEVFVTAWVNDEVLQPYHDRGPSPLGTCPECGADVIRQESGTSVCRNKHSFPTSQGD